jgi:hypothetical protein
MDEGAAFVIPQLRDVLKASVEHPWVSLFIMAAVYSVGMVVIAHLSALDIHWPWKARRPILRFGEWHAGTNSGYPSIVPGGSPSWISIRNTEVEAPEVARNVTIQIEWVNAAKTIRLPVPEADWYVKEGLPGRRTREAWTKHADIEGGDEQSCVLFVQGEQSKVWVYKNGSEPVGVLDYGRWNAHLVVSSDNAEGFEGTLAFTLKRSGLLPDSPAFDMRRRLPPRLAAPRRPVKPRVHTPPIRGEIIEGWFQTWAMTAIGALETEKERIPEGIAYIVLKVRLARRSDLPATTLRSFTLVMRGPNLAVELQAHRQRFDIQYAIDTRSADDQRVGGPPGGLAEKVTELGESEYIEPGRDRIGFLRFALEGIDEIEFLHAVDTSVFVVQCLDPDDVEHTFQRAGPLPSRGTIKALPLP